MNFASKHVKLYTRRRRMSLLAPAVVDGIFFQYRFLRECVHASDLDEIQRLGVKFSGNIYIYIYTMADQKLNQLTDSFHIQDDSRGRIENELS